MMAAGQHLRVMCDLSHICCGDHYSSAYCDTHIVCNDGVIRYTYIFYTLLSINMGTLQAQQICADDHPPLPARVLCPPGC